MRRRLFDRFWWLGILGAAVAVLVALLVIVGSQDRVYRQQIKGYERGAEIQAQLDSYCLGQRTAVRQIEENARRAGAPVLPGPGCLLHTELPKP